MMNRKFPLLVFYIFLFHLKFVLPQTVEPVSLPPVIIEQIRFSGNKLTKEYVLRRELILHEMDTFSSRESLNKELEICRNNLMNTSLFNFVTSELEEADGKVIIHFHFIERWYIWPVPIVEIAERNLNVWWQERNWDRINAGFIFAHNNFGGRRHRISGIFRYGYNQTYAMAYEAPYINQRKTIGVSISAGMNASHEVNTLLLNNKPAYFKNEDSYVRREYFVSLKGIYRRGINNSHTISTTYSSYRFSDTLAQINPDFLPSSINTLRLTTLSYLFKSDFRNYKSYPLSGYYADAELSRSFFHHKENKGYASLKITYRKYFKHNERLYSAFGISGRLTEKVQRPYMFTNALGLGRDFVRGYEYYLINGQQYVYEKANLKYNVVKEKVFTLPFIHSEKFSKLPFAAYANLFFDAAYVKDYYAHQLNPLSNKYLYGYGLGLDFVSYYDLVLRMEFSINHKMEKGLFFHMIAPI
jgi:outer membrane protein assembly factor BamA